MWDECYGINSRKLDNIKQQNHYLKWSGLGQNIQMSTSQKKKQKNMTVKTTIIQQLYQCYMSSEFVQHKITMSEIKQDKTGK